jgi:hypothetical protein
MLVCLHEVINREVIFAIKKPRATPDDLLEFNYRIDWTHEDNVTNIARIHAG